MGGPAPTTPITGDRSLSVRHLSGNTWDQEFESPLLQRGVSCELEFFAGSPGERGAKSSGDEAGGAGGAAETTGGKKAGFRKNRPRTRVGVPSKCDGGDMGGPGRQWPGRQLDQCDRYRR